jgi:hypothetical protein
LSVKLRERSAQKLLGLPPGEQRAALDVRNRLAVPLNDRMTKVRTVARFVFRDQPELARKVTSAYERHRRPASRRGRGTTESPDAAPAKGHGLIYGTGLLCARSGSTHWPLTQIRSPLHCVSNWQPPGAVDLGSGGGAFGALEALGALAGPAFGVSSRQLTCIWSLPVWIAEQKKRLP